MGWRSGAGTEIHCLAATGGARGILVSGAEDALVVGSGGMPLAEFFAADPADLLLAS
ncbi:MAG: hypothetical protein HY744_12000 [Deltaproteobacteria bacterium]|nr:hypothetical protein [Deltaproteobacteria bacterium]